MEKLRNLIDPGHKRDESIMYGTGNPDSALEDLHDGNKKTTTTTTTGSGIPKSTHQHQPEGHDDIHPHQSTTTHQGLTVSRPGPNPAEDPSSVASIKSGVQGRPPVGSAVLPVSDVSSTTTTPTSATTSTTRERAVPVVGAALTSHGAHNTHGLSSTSSDTGHTSVAGVHGIHGIDGITSTSSTAGMAGTAPAATTGNVGTVASAATSHMPGSTEPKSTILTKGPHITDTANRLDPQVNEGGFTLTNPVPISSASVTNASAGRDMGAGHHSHGASIGTAAAAAGVAGATGAATGTSTGAPYNRTVTDDRITKPVDIERENELAASRATGVGSDGLGAYETDKGVYHTKPSTTESRAAPAAVGAAATAGALAGHPTSTSSNITPTSPVATGATSTIGTTSHNNPLSSTTHAHKDTTGSGTSGLGAGVGAVGVAGIGSQAVSSKFYEGPANTAVSSNPVATATTTTKKTVTTDTYEPAGTKLVDRTVESGSGPSHRGGLFGHKDKHHEPAHHDNHHRDHHDEKKKHGGLVSGLLHRHHHNDHKDSGHHEYHGHHEKGSGYTHSPTSTTVADGSSGTYGTVGDTNKTGATHPTHNHRVDEVPATEAAKPHVLPDEYGHKKLHKEPPVGGI